MVILVSSPILHVRIIQEMSLWLKLRMITSAFICFEAQRSAQELPQIEKYSINSCAVSGGQEMVVTGSNFLPESKIIFFEKGQGKYYPPFLLENKTKTTP